MANKNLQHSATYKKCQQNLLQTEINNKKSDLNCIDFAHISTIFLSRNDNFLKTHDSIQQKKFNKLLIENTPKQDPEKVIFNFSKVSPTEAEKSLLGKGLSFSLPPKQLSYSDYLINFELFYRSIDNLKILSGDNLDFIKTRIKNTAFTSFHDYNTNVPQHLSNEEFEALKTPSGNCNLVIQKADKGNSVVIVEKDIYVRHMETILSDLNKFEKVSIKKGILNFSINYEKNINNYLKRLEESGSLSTELYKKIKAVGSRPGTLYGLCKVHKTLLRSVHHLDLYFLQLELLVTNLQNF